MLTNQKPEESVVQHGKGSHQQPHSRVELLWNITSSHSRRVDVHQQKVPLERLNLAILVLPATYQQLPRR